MAKTGAFGNTLTEYGLLLGCLCLVCLVSLSLLGNSTSSLLGFLHTNSNQDRLEKMSNMDFSDGSPNALTANSSQNASDQNNAALPMTTAIGKQSLNGSMVTGFNDGGTNATSVDGGKITVGSEAFRSTMGSAIRLQDIVDSTTDPLIKSKLAELTDGVYWLAGSQASLENLNGNQDLAALAKIIKGKQPDTQSSINAAVKSISDWTDKTKASLQSILQDPTIPAAQKAQVQALTNEVIQKTNQEYGATERQVKTQYPGFHNLGSLAPKDETTVSQLRTIGNQLLIAGKTDNTPTVKTSIQNGRILDKTASN